MFEIHKERKTNSTRQFKASVLIPTWNNIDYLKLCIRSVLTNSHFDHQIIIVINEGTDGTLEWVKENEFDYVYAKENIGICYGLNSCRSLIDSNYIVYANDDMYLLPNWDLYLFQEIDKIGHHYFMLSSTMIEPNDTGNPCVSVKNYGNSIENFQEEKLLNEFQSIEKKDWTGSSWPPNVMHIDTWDLVGGMSIEYSPGFYSDPDLSRKLWELGVRDFRGIGKSKVYHFGSKSTKKIKRNKGKNLFLNKWGITSNFFYKNYLKLGTENPILEYHISKKDQVIHYFKKLKNGLMKEK